MQQLGVILWIALVLAAVTDLVAQGPNPSRLVFFLALLLGMPIVLAAEFALMACVNARHRLPSHLSKTGEQVALTDGPRRRLSTLVKAYLGECGSALRVFAWQQPFLGSREPDHAPLEGSGGARGVLLVHGFACNRGLWLSWLQGLRAQGTPFIAVNLEPPWGPIERYARTIEGAVARLERQTGLAPVVVAHSMGGLAVRSWWLGTGTERIHRLITLGSPQEGTLVAGLSFMPNVRQMRRGNAWLATLAANESDARRARMSCFWSWCDNIVFPASTAALPGAENFVLHDVAHVAMVWHPAPWKELQRWLASVPPSPIPVRPVAPEQGHRARPPSTA